MSNKYLHPVIVCDASGEPTDRDMGITKRDYFACQMMVAFVSRNGPDSVSFGDAAVMAASAADTLIKVLK